MKTLNYSESPPPPLPTPRIRCRVDVMATHMYPFHPTELSSHRPLKSRFDAASARVKCLELLLSMWREGTSSYRIHVCNELSKFNVWGDDFDATGGGLDIRLRDSKELRKTVEWTLDKFKDAMEGGKHYLLLYYCCLQ